MKGIALTNKTLVILALILGLLIIAGYTVTPKFMAFVIKEYEMADNQEISLVLKDRLIRFFPGSEEARWVIYSYADRFMQRNERIIIGPDFIGGGVGEDIPISPEKVSLHLRRVAEAQKEVMWKYNVYEKLADFYHSQANYEDAEGNYLIAAQGFEKEKKDFRIAEINRKLVDIYLETGKPDLALSLVEQSLEKYSSNYRGQFLAQKGDVHFQLGEYFKAEECYKDALVQAEKDWAEFMANRADKAEHINASLEQQPVYRHSKSRLEEIRSVRTDDKTENGRVAGQILKGSNPLSNVMVYLINEKAYDGRMSHFDGIEANASYKTDNEGRFAFDGVAPGRYLLVLGMVPQDLEGIGRLKGLEAFTVEPGQTREFKFNFQPKVKIIEPVGQQTYTSGQQLKISWEEVPQAETYNLQVTLKLENGYVSRVYRSGLQGNSYVFDPQGLALREMNFVAWSDGYILAPSAILGSFYPGAEIFFAIEAVNGEGQSISDSEGYVLQINGNYPSIQIKGDAYVSSGDSLVREKKYAEAVKAYLLELQEEPGNLNALLSLARLYNYGWTEGTSDLSKAVEYYDQLLLINRDSYIVEEAAGANIQAGNYHEAIRLYEEIKDTMGTSIYWYHQMGELYFKTGMTKKALQYYQVYLNKEKKFRDLGPVIALLYNDDIRGAIKMLKENEYSQRMRYNRNGEPQNPADINVLIKRLESYAQGEKSVLDKAVFRSYLMELINTGGPGHFEKMSAFQARLNTLRENDVLAAVLRELAKDRS